MSECPLDEVQISSQTDDVATNASKVKIAPRLLDLVRAHDFGYYCTPYEPSAAEREAPRQRQCGGLGACPQATKKRSSSCYSTTPFERRHLAFSCGNELEPISRDACRQCTADLARSHSAVTHSPRSTPCSMMSLVLCFISRPAASHHDQLYLIKAEARALMHPALLLYDRASCLWKSFSDGSTQSHCH